MSAYSELRDLVREQVNRASSGDVEGAVGLMPRRQSVLASVPRPTPADTTLIQEVLALDRQLAGFIRERMLSIREQALTLQHGQTALHGYGSISSGRGARLNTLG